MKKLFLRSGIIAFWILLIGSFLYLPKWKQLKWDKNTINVFVWGDVLSPAVIAQFEKKSGIRVNLSYYSSNEELIVKLKATRGEGYDLIVPSDYAVDVLRKGDLLKPLNKSKFLYWNELNPHLINHYFDPDNTYSIPFEWEVFGLGINRDYFATHPFIPSWQMIFNPTRMQNYKIAMNNDPLEAISFASFYLYGPLHTLSPSQADGVERLLTEQNPFVTAYASFRGDYFLATQNVPLVVASNSYIWRAKRYCDFVKFVVPKEGSFITIENFCIPKPSQKEDLVFAFINYLCTKPSVISHFDSYYLFPATTHALDELQMDEEAKALWLSVEQDFAKYHFIRSILPPKEVRDIWVSVKS